MTAEQFIDAVATLTGVWQTPTGDLLKVDGRGQGGQVGAVRDVLRSRESPSERESGSRSRARWRWTTPSRERWAGRIASKSSPAATRWRRCCRRLELVNGTISRCDPEPRRPASGCKTGQHDPRQSSRRRLSHGARSQVRPTSSGHGRCDRRRPATSTESTICCGWSSCCPSSS